MTFVPSRILLTLLLVAASACSVSEAACGKAPGEASVLPTAITGESAQPQAPTGFTIAFLGDSLTAGLGLLTNQNFPRLIGEKFVAEGFADIDVMNAGLSGDTTASGLRRAGQVLTDPSIRIMVVALGGNDALRGLSVAESKENLRQIIELGLSRDVYVMLCGMQAPTNLGEDYQTSFKQMYFDLLRDYQRRIVYVSFLLEGVAGRPEMNQPDGIHPNEAGAKVIADLLFPQLRSMVDQVGGG